MNVGFFADDSSACHAALLANNAFNRRSVDQPQVLIGTLGVVEAIPAYLEAAIERDSHLMVALPLAGLHDQAIRSRLAVAVVTVGTSPLARVAARQMMTREVERGSRGLPPAWQLESFGNAGPTMPHTLPVRMAPLGGREAIALRLGCDCGPLNWRAIGLAASIRIVAEDPYATTVDPAEVARLLAGGFLESDARLREDLLDLAAALDDGVEEATWAAGRRHRPQGSLRRAVFTRRKPIERVAVTRSPLAAPAGNCRAAACDDVVAG